MSISNINEIKKIKHQKIIISNLNFNASYLKDVKVKKYDPISKEYYDSDVSFVKFDPENPKDRQALKDLAENWDDSVFAGDINKDYDTFKDNDRFVLYAVTSQRKNFDNLDYQKVLALGESFIENGNDNLLFVKYLQVNPKIIDDPFAEYKKVGTAFLDGAKAYYNRIELYSLPSRVVREFYERNDFKRYIGKDYDYAWDA